MSMITTGPPGQVLEDEVQEQKYNKKKKKKVQEEEVKELKYKKNKNKKLQE